jgi:hypothetical protein
MENRKRISISVIAIILGLIFMFYFENELDKIGTYESINLLYMLASQAVFFGGLVGLIVSLLALKDEKAIESMEIKVDTTATTLLYILSFFIPLAGFIVGAIYASKDEEHYKYIGKNCLIFSVLNIVLDVIIIAVMLGSM